MQLSILDGTAPQLLIVMPVYNERASVSKVVEEWLAEVSRWTQDFVLLAIDDGSTDGSAEVLERLRERFGPRVEVVRQANCGHGQACLRGYRAALVAGATHVLQIDSDGQCDPQYFGLLWAMRADYDVVYGHRRRRNDGWHRVAASWAVRILLLALFRINCVDANVPYRLMRTPVLQLALPRIPSNFVLANVALAALLRQNVAVRHGSVPIGFRERYGGEPSVRFKGFVWKAIELHRQLRTLFAREGEVDAELKMSGQT